MCLANYGASEAVNLKLGVGNSELWGKRFGLAISQLASRVRGRGGSEHMLPTLSKKWAPFYVLYSGGHKCNSLWGVSLRSGVTQI
jgi:hypothetical protein